MNEHEEALYQAIVDGDRPLVKQLADAEFQRFLLGNRFIRPDATRGDGNTLAHAVAVSGEIGYVGSIIELWSLDTYRENAKRELPEDLVHPWSNLHKGLKSIRERQETENRYRERVQSVVYTELEQGGYQTGIVFTSQLNLFYGSKNPKKHCDIPGNYASEGEFSVFDKMVITEALLVNFSQTVDGLEGPRGKLEGLPIRLESTNYLLAHVGVVISDCLRQKSGGHTRIFIRAPVYFQTHPYMRASNNKEHSEAYFYRVLGIKDNLEILFKDLFKQIPDLQGRKVYALVWDFHSSQDMCNGCEDETYLFQTTVLPNITKIFTETFGMVLSSKYNPLRTVLRISSVRPSTSNLPKLEHRNSEYFGRAHTHNRTLDLKKSQSPLILHSDEQYRKQLAKWYSKKTYEQLHQKSIRLDRFTVFVNNSGFYYEAYKSPQEVVVEHGLK